MSNILLLEDDISLIDGLSYSLQRNGFEIGVVRTVGEAIGHLADSDEEVNVIRGLDSGEMITSRNLLS